MSRPFKTRLDQLQGKKNTAAQIAATLSLRELPQGDRRLVPLSLAAGQAITLPFATGKGSTYRLFVQTTYTGSTTIVTQAGNNPVTGARDALFGQAAVSGGTAGTFGTNGGHTITMNGTTQGGLKGSYIELEDVAAGIWRVKGALCGSGVCVTPFS